MAKKKRVKQRKIILIFLIIFAILLLLCSFNFKKKDKKRKVKQEVKVEETIEGYNYELDDNETLYYKDLFQKLKQVLEKEPVEEDKYASLICQLFLADFFNLDNKISNNDIGGTQFVYADFRDDFENLAKSSVYHYVESDVYDDRKQELPKVKEVSVVNIETTSFTYLDQKDDNAYQVDLNVSYETDLGYQEGVTLVLVHNDDKLEIIKMTE